MGGRNKISLLSTNPQFYHTVLPYIVLAFNETTPVHSTYVSYFHAVREKKKVYDAVGMIDMNVFGDFFFRMQKRNVI